MQVQFYASGLGSELTKHRDWCTGSTYKLVAFQHHHFIEHGSQVADFAGYEADSFNSHCLMDIVALIVFNDWRVRPTKES